MPAKKKYPSPSPRLNTSRRLLQSVAIKDLTPGGTCRYRNPDGTIPTAPPPCICNKQDCPGRCCSLQGQCKPPPNQHETCAPRCEGFNKDIDEKQELIRSVAQDGSDGYQQNFSTNDKGVSIRDPNVQNNDLIPDCCKPATSTGTRSMQGVPITKPAFDPRTAPKDFSCDACKNPGVSVVPKHALQSGVPTTQNEEYDDYCSDDTCGKDVFNREKSGGSSSPSAPSDNMSVAARQSSTYVPPSQKLKEMPLGAPPPRKRTSNTIAKTSSHKLLGKLLSNNMKIQSPPKVDDAKTGEEKKDTTSFQKLLGFFGKNNDKNAGSGSDCSCAMVPDEQTDDFIPETKNTPKAETKRLSGNKRDLIGEKDKRISLEGNKKQITNNGNKDNTKLENKRLSRETKNDLNRVENKRISQENGKRDSIKQEKRPSRLDEHKDPSKEKTISLEDSTNYAEEEEIKNITRDDNKKDLAIDERRDIKSVARTTSKSCGIASCSVNTCTCRFPPAYSQYFDCTGRISGHCNCGENN